MHKQKNDTTLALFFTYGVSLKEWDRIGILKREIALYNKLAKKINKIYFFTYGDYADLNYKHLLADNITIIPKPFKIRNKLYSLLLPLIHIKILKECDIFKTNQMDGAWTAVSSKILFRKKLIVRTGYCWSIFLKKLNKKRKYVLARVIEHIVYKFADLAVVTSEQDKKYLFDKYKRNNVEVIPNYVDTNTFKPLNIKKKKNEICFVGRLSKQKNIDMLINALNGTGISLNVIGDGEEKDSLIKLSKEKNVQIKFHGIVPSKELPTLLNQFEIFVLPSHFEGNPKALLEAMACGICCVGTNVEGIKEVIKNGETGILCEKNVESLHSAIINISQNNRLRNKLGKNAIKNINNNYSLHTIYNTELNLLQSLT